MTQTEVSTKILDKINELVNSIELNKISNLHQHAIIQVTSEIIQNLSKVYKELTESHKS